MSMLSNPVEPEGRICSAAPTLLKVLDINRAAAAKMVYSWTFQMSELFEDYLSSPKSVCDGRLSQHTSSQIIRRSIASLYNK